MSTTRDKLTLQKQISDAWIVLRASVNTLGPDCEIKPVDHRAIFQFDWADPGTTKLKIRPVVFRLKEFAKSLRADMFVTIAGSLHFTNGTVTQPLACHYNSQVGYFRRKGKFVDHVLGLHYDFDKSLPGHPVFHAQLASQQTHLQFINKYFQPELELSNDRMQGVATKVRLPTAHMDPMAVFVQLLADHLVNQNSGASEIKAFEEARASLMFFKSDPQRCSRLQQVHQENCFRGPRWYPIPAR